MAKKNVFKIIKRLLQKRCFHWLIYLSVTGILIACIEVFGLRKILATNHVFARYPRSFERNAVSVDEYRASTPESYSSRSLALELRRKLQLAEGTPDLNVTFSCHSLGVVKDCNGTGERCLQDELPADLETRVKQLAFGENLQVPVRYRDVMRSFAEQIPGVYDVIIVTALSSNHFKESQAFLKSLHAEVFPLLSNFHLVMFDIGLSTEENTQLKKHCRCTVVNFTFEEFPPHFKSLKCFAWKPVIIGSVYFKADVVIWMDASIRFHLPDAIPVMISKAKRQGVVLRHNPANAASPYYTLKQMFEYFGDSPCAHLLFDQVESGFGLYHR
ncbi:uncharacterized protein LOC131938177 [Physella acuta]|uniref:uncharacterized protein LOC131938177 n=1 Tax=Physella acuta TaxID=109671 RepID=UPI0027DB7F6F|nr:uncharacterized protein LOC131938177 [Physella acuta]